MQLIERFLVTKVHADVRCATSFPGKCAVKVSDNVWQRGWHLLCLLQRGKRRSLVPWVNYQFLVRIA